MNPNRTEPRAGRRPRLIAAAAAVAATTMLAAACGTADGSVDAAGTADKKGPFTLYASLGMSGGDSTFAPALKAGLDAAVTTINKNGGLLGREVKLEVENNESDATKAVSLTQKRIATAAPDLVWAGATSSETLALQGLLTREKIIGLNNASSPQAGDATKFPYGFSAGLVPEAVAEFLASSLKDKGYKTVGVLAGNNAFGQAAVKQYTATFQAAGLTVVSETYEPDAVEMDGPLSRLATHHPDAIVFNDFVHPAYILKSRVKVGMGDVPFIGDASSTVGDISGAVSDEQKKGVLLTAASINTSTFDRPGAENLLKSLNSAGVDISTSLGIYELAYDPVLAYANAVGSVGSFDVDKVRAAMEAGKGNTYQLALADNLGWTDKVHLASAANAYRLIPISPLKTGQFQVNK